MGTRKKEEGGRLANLVDIIANLHCNLASILPLLSPPFSFSLFSYLSSGQFSRFFLGSYFCFLFCFCFCLLSRISCLLYIYISISPGQLRKRGSKQACRSHRQTMQRRTLRSGRYGFPLPFNSEKQKLTACPNQQVKKLIKRLTEARGNGTSMISLIIPPKDQISRAAKMLAEEYVGAPIDTHRTHGMLLTPLRVPPPISNLG